MTMRSNSRRCTITIPPVSFLAKTLKEDVYSLCLPEGRMIGTPGHEKAIGYLLQRLEDIGCRPYQDGSFELPYRSEGRSFTNLIGVVPGRDSSVAPLLVGAHYDSVIEAACADDNGAAVAICLALAGIMQGNASLDRDLIVALFDAEEPPWFQTPSMGSNRFYEDQVDERGIHAAIIFDLVGHDISIPAGWLPHIGKLLNRFPRLADWDLSLPMFKGLVFMTGAESHPDLVQVMEGTKVPRGLKLMAALNDYVGDMSDQGAFRLNGVPYLFFSCGRWAHYHMETDTRERLNYRKMARITQMVARVLRGLDTADLEAGAPGEDTVEFEAETLRAATGPFYGLLLRWAGLKEIRTREQIKGHFPFKMLDGHGVAQEDSRRNWSKNLCQPTGFAASSAAFSTSWSGDWLSLSSLSSGPASLPS